METVFEWAAKVIVPVVVVALPLMLKQSKWHRRQNDDHAIVIQRIDLLGDKVDLVGGRLQAHVEDHQRTY